MADSLLRAVAEQGYTEPTPIQLQAIPVILSGRDILGAAQTGTGKTASFTLPMLQRLSTSTPTHPTDGTPPIRALVLTPTRELASQVHESIRTYGQHLNLRSTTIFGGVNINPQIAELRRGVDILVATPGRLLDHAGQGTLSLGHIEILVLDEADRMLDMGFIHDIRRVLALLPAQRQNLLFSATFSDDIRKLASTLLNDPVTIEVARRNTPAELVAQVAYLVDRERKRELLAHLVKTNQWQQVLVFTRTKHGANRLAQQLERDGIIADAIHGNKSQPARTRALKRFKAGELQVLVATDIAARGLDIEALPHVVNYDLPHVAEDYVHRIGRTGRAGESGAAVSLVSQDDRPLLVAIERLMNRPVEQRTLEGFEPGTASSEPRRADEDVPRPPRPQQRMHRQLRGPRAPRAPREPRTHHPRYSAAPVSPAGAHAAQPAPHPYLGKDFDEESTQPIDPKLPISHIEPQHTARPFDIEDEDERQPDVGPDGRPLSAHNAPPYAAQRPAGKRRRRRQNNHQRPSNAAARTGTPSATDAPRGPRPPMHGQARVPGQPGQQRRQRRGPRPGQGSANAQQGHGNSNTHPNANTHPNTQARHPNARPRPANARPGGAPGQRRDGRGARPTGGYRGTPGTGYTHRGPTGARRSARPLDPMEEERLRQVAEGKRLARSEKREPGYQPEPLPTAKKRTPITTIVKFLKRRVA